MCSHHPHAGYSCIVPVVEYHFRCGVLVSVQSKGSQYTSEQVWHSSVADSTSLFILLPLLIFVVVVAVHRVSNAIGIEKQKGGPGTARPVSYSSFIGY